mgnify:CR=1 FL=1
MLSEKRQNILLVALIVCIILMTVKALTTTARNYDEEISSLRKEQEQDTGALKEAIAQIQRDIQTELSGLNESVSDLSTNIENHRHQWLMGNTVFDTVGKH